MSTITKPNTFASGNVIQSSPMNANFDTIYDDYNGSISNVNLALDAGIVLTKIAGHTRQLYIPSQDFIMNDGDSAVISRNTLGGNGGGDINAFGANEVAFRVLSYTKTADKYAYCMYYMPSDINAKSVTINIYWTSDQTAGTVKWIVLYQALADDGALTARDSMSTVSFDADTMGGTAYDIMIASKTAALTMAAGTPYLIGLQRDVSEDTLDDAAQFIGMSIE